MRGKTVLFMKLMIILFGQSSASSHCDTSTTAKVHEGNLGQTPDFNWLGILRVHLHDGDSVQLAVTGLVLIKEKFALSNADDVAKIPQHIFKTDTRAMFIAYGDTPWYVTPVSYVTHPEYEYYTYNSIAIIELSTDDDEDFPLNPICFPTVMYNASTYLYLTGYTDENKLFEKVFYKIHYLPKTACEEFYDRAGLTDKNHLPSTYLCGYSPYNGTHCVWDNGMALVSNATGWFTLIGFGVRGPGCMAPARFIDLFPYFTWINTVTSEEDFYDSPDYRRQDGVEFVPAHKLFLSNTTRPQPRNGFVPYRREMGRYPFKTIGTRAWTVQPYYDDSVIAIFPFNNTLEMYTKSCSANTALMYREIFNISSSSYFGGHTIYELSLYDLEDVTCACVLLTVDCHNRSEALISFKDYVDAALTTSAETPEKLFHYFPQKKTKSPFEKEFERENPAAKEGINHNLYIRFDFVWHATLTFEMYASSHHKPPKLTTTPKKTGGRRWEEMEVHRRTTSKPYNKVKGPKVKEPKVKELKVKEPRVTLIAKHDVVQETVSQGCRNQASLVLVMEHFVLSLTLRRAFFIN